MYEPLELDKVNAARKGSEVVYRWDGDENDSIWLILVCDGTLKVMSSINRVEVMEYIGADVNEAVTCFRQVAARMNIELWEDYNEVSDQCQEVSSESDDRVVDF